MDLKTAQFLTKLVIEDDEDDVVYFAFPNQRRKIKCSISMLAEISPVFEAMFSARWQEEKEVVDVESVDPKDKTIQLSDAVNFDQYSAFKLLVQILYGLFSIDSLTVEQATNVYFYSHKYEIKDVEEKIQKLLNQRMESGMSKLPLTVRELTESIEFAQSYGLDEFKKKLDRVKLAFDDDNPIQFWTLAKTFDLSQLKQQVLDHLKTLAPKDDWPVDALLAVIGCLQVDQDKIKESIKTQEQRSRCSCGGFDSKRTPRERTLLDLSDARKANINKFFMTKT